MNEVKIPALKLPSYLREILSMPQGVLYVPRIKDGILSDLKADVAIGDIVSQRHYSGIKVFDHKTKRKIVEQLSNDIAHRSHIIVYNLPGSISIHAFTTSMTKIRKVLIKGEEDLIAIPYLRNNTIIYGQPNTGVVVVESNKFLFLKILKALKPSIVKICD